MVYSILKFIIRLATRIFYREVSIQNKQLIPKNKNKALLIVSNHPNTFMDPILIASILPQEVHFLSNGSVFKTKFHHWLLGNLNMIPIYRKKDKNGSNNDNQKTFEKCFEHLQKQKSILIFPEGSSYIERKIRPIKTGTARIALGAEAFSDFDANIEILPIGLNYDAQNYFRSKIHIRIGETIPIKKYQTLFEENENIAIQTITNTIQEKLEELTIITENEQEDEMVKNLETIYHHEWKKEINHLSKEKEYVLAKELTKAVTFFKKENSSMITLIQEKLSDYFQLLAKHNIHDKNIHSPTSNILLDGLFLLLTFPFYAFGLLNNYLAYKLPSFLTYKITKDESYFAPIALGFGILSFLIFYTLQGTLFYHFLESPIFLFSYLISLPLSGLFTFSYWKKVQLFKQEIRWKKLKRIKQEAEKLNFKRAEIINILEKAKTSFFEAKENEKNTKIIQH